MRGRFLALSVWAACGFAPNNAATPSADAPDSGMGSGSGSGSGSGMGSGSGSGSGCAQDVDGDGICDDVDDWLCGTKPSAPGNFNVTTFAYQFQDSSVKLDNVGQTLLAVTPNQAFSVEFGYQFTVGCNANNDCTVQIELGTDVAKDSCVDNKTVRGAFVLGFQIGSGNGTAQTTMTLPTAGLYTLLATPYKADQCPNGWGAGSTPDSRQVVGIVCVR